MKKWTIVKYCEVIVNDFMVFILVIWFFFIIEQQVWLDCKVLLPLSHGKIYVQMVH